MSVSSPTTPFAGDPSIGGFASPGFESVAQVFVSTLQERGGGAALSVRVGGETVVDMWGGSADARNHTPWQASTPSVIFSCTKGLVSILAAHLVSEGRLDYDARVATYWPEFAQAGKDQTLVRHLLSHRAGLSAPREDLTLDDIVDWDTMVRVLAQQEPLWHAGSGWGYHALTHGWLNGELIRRITGKSVGAFFDELIATPLSADAWIGLPQHLLGVPARLELDEPEQSVPHRVLLTSPTVGGPVSAEFTDEEWTQRAMTMGGALAGLVASDKPDFNDPRMQTAEIPGAGGIATARALATIWSATVVETDGVRLLTDDVIRTATVVESEGPAVFSSETPPYPRWGMGFMLNSERRRFLTPSSFGHDGAGGQVGFADPHHRVGFGYISNRLGPMEDNRATAIIDELRIALGERTE